MIEYCMRVRFRYSILFAPYREAEANMLDPLDPSLEVPISSNVHDYIPSNSWRGFQMDTIPTVNFQGILLSIGSMIGFISGHVAFLRKRISVIWGVKFGEIMVDSSCRRLIAQIADHPRFDMTCCGAMMKSFVGFCHVLLLRGRSESFVWGDGRIFRLATYPKMAILSMDSHIYCIRRMSNSLLWF